MKWVKASERLPEGQTQIVIKYDEGNQREAGTPLLLTELIENGWLDCEWLDESSPDTSFAEGLLRWMATNHYQSTIRGSWKIHNSPITETPKQVISEYIKWGGDLNDPLTEPIKL